MVKCGSGSSESDALCPRDGLPCTFERTLACLRRDVVNMSLKELMEEGMSFALTLARIKILRDIGADEKRDLEVAEGFKLLLEVVNSELAHRGLESISVF